MIERKYDRLKSLRKPDINGTEGTAVFRSNRKDGAVLGRRESNEFLERLLFRDTGGREVMVEIISKERIGYGEMSNIYRARVRFPDVHHPKEGIFVLKEFKRVYGDVEAKSALNNYAKLNDAGITTWTTYMLATDKPIILMNDGEMSDEFLISFTPSNSKDILEKLPALEITNMAQALKDGVEMCRKCAQNSIFLRPDAWMGLIRPESPQEGGPATIKFLIRDFETIRTAKDTETLQIIDNFRVAILNIIAKCTINKDWDQYKRDRHIVDEILAPIMRQEQALLSTATKKDGEAD